MRYGEREKEICDLLTNDLVLKESTTINLMRQLCRLSVKLFLADPADLTDQAF